MRRVHARIGRQHHPPLARRARPVEALPHEQLADAAAAHGRVGDEHAEGRLVVGVRDLPEVAVQHQRHAADDRLTVPGDEQLGPGGPAGDAAQLPLVLLGGEPLVAVDPGGQLGDAREVGGRRRLDAQGLDGGGLDHVPQPRHLGSTATMSSLSERLNRGSASSPSQVDHARRLVADWQLLAELAFADLTLWVPLQSGHWWCVAQVRPLTAPTSQPDDLVGAEASGTAAEPFGVAYREGRPVTEGEPDWSGASPRRREVIPVRHDGVVVAVLAKDTNLAVTPAPASLELHYLDIDADLCLMVSAGTFPPQKLQDAELSPRVGDGLVRIDAEGRASYASPNALSAYRRMGLTGDLVGADLADLTRATAADRVAGEAVAAGITAAVSGRFPDPMDVEGSAGTMLVRALPLQAPGVEEGALVLVRDVTDVRSRDRALLTKDATIREIHHRVKNNLQTVAALLRLQARRMTEPAARAALEESVRRVASIAVVHETLAGSREDVVAVDDVIDRVLPMLGDLASIGPAARTQRIGTFGELPAAAATPLVLAVTELLHNAAEHAFLDGEPGTIELVAERTGDDLVVRVRDDGRGLPDGFDPVADDGLGLQIVRTLVTTELGGSLSMTSPPSTGPGDRPGTEVVLTLPGAGVPRR